MSKNIFSCLLCLLTINVLAGESNVVLKTELMSRRALAGRLERRESMKGKIAFIDTQSRMSKQEFQKVISLLTEEREFNYVYEKAEWTADYNSLKEQSKAAIAIIVTDNKELPPILISPDQNWGMMNIAGLDANLKSNSAKEKFLPGRYCKQLLRVFGMTVGGWRSGYQGNISSANKISDLDVAPYNLPVDVQDRNMRHMKFLGITPRLYTSYYTACQEGWAPAPTNDVQKAIWDKVHSIPSEPIKIKP